MAANMTDPAAAQAALQAELATLLTASADYRLTREFWSERGAIWIDGIADDPGSGLDGGVALRLL